MLGNDYLKRHMISQSSLNMGSTRSLGTLLYRATPSYSIRRFSHHILSADSILPRNRVVVGCLSSPMRLDSTPSSNYSTRFFSSSRRQTESKTSDTLVNEALIEQVRRIYPNAKGPEEMTVRLVIDQGPEEPAKVEICSLAEAIAISLDRMTDLIGIAMKSDPPVIRAARLSKLEYEQKEKLAANKKASAKSKQKKTFRFRASIDSNDLNRKIQDMTKFLQEGIECEYTVFSKARTLRENVEAGRELVERIQGLISHCAVLKRAPEENEVGNHIRVLLIPKKSK